MLAAICASQRHPLTSALHGQQYFMRRLISDIVFQNGKMYGGNTSYNRQALKS